MIFIRIPSQDSQVSKQSVLEHTEQQCNVMVAHGVEWHRVSDSRTQKQCDTSQYSMTQHETRSDKAEQNRIERNRVRQNITQDKSRAK